MTIFFSDLFRIFLFFFFFVCFFCYGSNEKRYIDLVFSDESKCARDIIHNNIALSLDREKLSYVDPCNMVTTVDLNSLQIVKSSFLRDIIGYEPSGTVDIFSGKNIFITDRDFVYSLDNDHNLRWKYTNNMPVVYVQEHNDNVIVRFSDLSADILDIFTGDTIWNIPGSLTSMTPIMWIKSSLYNIPVWRDKIFFDLNNDSLISYLVNDYSSHVWSKQLGDMRSFHMASGFLYGPEVLGGILFVVTRSKEIIAVNPDNGNILWSRFIHDFYPESNLFLLDNRVCYIVSTKKIQCFDKKDGRSDLVIDIQNILLTSFKNAFWAYTQRFGENFFIIVSSYGSAHIFSKNADRYHDSNVAQLGGPINKVLFVEDKIITLLFDGSVRIFTW